MIVVVNLKIFLKFIEMLVFLREAFYPRRYFIERLFPCWKEQQKYFQSRLKGIFKAKTVNMQEIQGLETILN